MADNKDLTIIERDLPAPVISDGTRTILMLSQLIASGEHEGVKYEVDGMAFTFAAVVTYPDGTRRREVLRLQDTINAWVTQLIDEGPTPPATPELFPGTQDALDSLTIRKS